MSDKDDPVLKALDVSQEVIAQSAHPSASYAFKCIEKAIAIQKAQARVSQASGFYVKAAKKWTDAHPIRVAAEAERLEAVKSIAWNELLEALAALDEVKK